jgi:type IV secretion system protein VirB1
MRAICGKIKRPWWLLFWVCVAIAGTTISIDAVMSAIKQVESGGRPFAILDNATGKSYFLADEAAAVAKAKSLLDLGHNIDMGLMQLNSIHLKRPGVTVDNVFSLAIQDTISRAIFNEFWTLSKAQNGDNDLAVWRAVGAYNMGARGIRVDNVSYTNKVQARMGLSPRPSVGAEETAARMGTVPTNPLLNPTPKPTIPGEWKVGDPLEATSATETGADDDESELIAILLALLMIAVVLLLVKVGLLWWAVKTVLSWSARQASKQMARRRDRDYSVS